MFIPESAEGFVGLDPALSSPQTADSAGSDGPVRGKRQDGGRHVPI